MVCVDRYFRFHVFRPGCIRLASELKSAFSAKGVSDKLQVIAYCGGGISSSLSDGLPKFECKMKATKSSGDQSTRSRQIEKNQKSYKRCVKKYKTTAGEILKELVHALTVIPEDEQRKRMQAGSNFLNIFRQWTSGWVLRVRLNFLMVNIHKTTEVIK